MYHDGIKFPTGSDFVELRDEPGISIRGTINGAKQDISFSLHVRAKSVHKIAEFVERAIATTNR